MEYFLPTATCTGKQYFDDVVHILTIKDYFMIWLHVNELMRVPLRPPKKTLTSDFIGLKHEVHTPKPRIVTVRCVLLT